MSSSSFSRLLRSPLRLPSRSFSIVTTTEATKTTTDETRSANTRLKTMVGEIFRERDYSLIVKKFKECSELYRFRCMHNVYERIVLRLAAAKRFSCIEAILEEQKKHTHLATEGFWVRLITLYGRAGMFTHALQMFEEIPKLGCTPTIKSVNAVLTACADAKDFAKVESFFHELPEKLGVSPDVYSYNILARAHCEMGNLDLAYSLLEKMKKNGVDPNLVSFNTLLNGLYRDESRRSEAEKIWEMMRSCGVEPDVKSFNAKMRGLVAEGRLDESWKVLDDLQSRGLKPDFMSFAALLKGSCKEGKVEEAKRILSEMKKQEILPNRTIYEEVIPLLCKEKELDMGFELCKQALKRGCFINVEILQDVVNRLIESSATEYARKLVELGSEKSYYGSSLQMPV